jgi:hypothetical protein
MYKEGVIMNWNLQRIEFIKELLLMTRNDRIDQGGSFDIKEGVLTIRTVGLMRLSVVRLGLVKLLPQHVVLRRYPRSLNP